VAWEELKVEVEKTSYDRTTAIVRKIAGLVKETHGWRGHEVCTAADGLLA
jgi:hypothetical protein